MRCPASETNEYGICERIRKQVRREAEIPLGLAVVKNIRYLDMRNASMVTKGSRLEARDRLGRERERHDRRARQTHARRAPPDQICDDGEHLGKNCTFWPPRI